jgi:hypothetical protein
MGIFYYENVEARERWSAKAIEDALRGGGKVSRRRKMSTFLRLRLHSGGLEGRFCRLID